jgi:hypothetical protein
LALNMSTDTVLETAAHWCHLSFSLFVTGVDSAAATYSESFRNFRHN